MGNVIKLITAAAISGGELISRLAGFRSDSGPDGERGGAERQRPELREAAWGSPPAGKSRDFMYFLFFWGALPSCRGAAVCQATWCCSRCLRQGAPSELLPQTACFSPPRCRLLGKTC